MVRTLHNRVLNTLSPEVLQEVWGHRSGSGTWEIRHLPEKGRSGQGPGQPRCHDPRQLALLE